MNNYSRRDFLAVPAAAACTLPLTSALAHRPEARCGKAPLPFGLGIASYSFRSFPLDQVIQMTKRLGMTRLTLKDMHLPLTTTEAGDCRPRWEDPKPRGWNSSPAASSTCKPRKSPAGLCLCESGRAEDTLSACPTRPCSAWQSSYVKETDIALAIHNHGPTDKRFPSPESAYGPITEHGQTDGSLHRHRPYHEARARSGASRPSGSSTGCWMSISRMSAAAERRGKTVEIGRGVIDIPGSLPPYGG